MAKVEYRPAPEVAVIADSLIGEYHTHLIGIRIEYVFRSEAAKKKGKIVLGTARKIGGLNAYLSLGLGLDELPGDDDLDFFVVEIAEDCWPELTSRQQRALVDHELMHLKVEITDDDGWKLGTTGHDLEAFTAEVERHGLWKPDLSDFGKVAADALKLPFPE